MIRVEDLCKTCKHFDLYDYECKQGHYLEGESEMFTVECEDYEDDEE